MESTFTNSKHSGVPFKFDKIIKTHTKFVQDVKYARSGDYFASVGSDYKVFLYDGKSGDELGEFTGEEHKGSVVSYIFSLLNKCKIDEMLKMACSWSPDSRTLATSAMDGTVKLCTSRYRTDHVYLGSQRILTKGTLYCRGRGK